MEHLFAKHVRKLYIMVHNGTHDGLPLANGWKSKLKIAPMATYSDWLQFSSEIACYFQQQLYDLSIEAFVFTDERKISLISLVKEICLHHEKAFST